MATMADKWLKNAINPEHKGYCTPMSKKTCTPRRKALARRFKRGDLHHESSDDHHRGCQCAGCKYKAIFGRKKKPEKKPDESLSGAANFLSDMIIDEGGHKAGCQCGFCKNKGRFGKKAEKDSDPQHCTNCGGSHEAGETCPNGKEESMLTFIKAANEFLVEAGVPANSRKNAMGDTVHHDPFEDDDEESNEYVIGAEEKLEAELIDAFGDLGYRAESFESAGIMTRNRGIVIRGPLGKFQITIVEDRRG